MYISTSVNTWSNPTILTKLPQMAPINERHQNPRVWMRTLPWFPLERKDAAFTSPGKTGGPGMGDSTDQPVDFSVPDFKTNPNRVPLQYLVVHPTNRKWVSSP